MSEIKSILAMKDNTARQNAIKTYVDTAITKIDVSAFEALSVACLDVSVPLKNVQGTLSYFLENITSLDAKVVRSILQSTLDQLSSRAASFPDEIVQVREILADAHALENDLAASSKVLQGIVLDSCARVKTEAYQGRHYTRIAENYLASDDPVSADSYINRAWPLINFKDMRKVTPEEEARALNGGPESPAVLPLRFMACQSRVHDAKRKFLDAAQKYYELSTFIPENQQIDTLRCAAVCILLADAGPRRHRLLTTLYKDERTQQLGTLFNALAKVFHDRILRPKDTADIKQFLRPHHEAITADGSTVLQRAIIQHNLVSASKLYYNITFQELGALLGVSPERAEKVAATMIAQEQLKGTIDQLQSMIVFENDMEVTKQWDFQINAACNAVESISNGIITEHTRFEALLKTS